MSRRATPNRQRVVLYVSCGVICSSSRVDLELGWLCCRAGPGASCCQDCRARAGDHDCDRAGDHEGEAGAAVRGEGGGNEPTEWCAPHEPEEVEAGRTCPKPVRGRQLERCQRARAPEDV